VIKLKEILIALLLMTVYVGLPMAFAVYEDTLPPDPIENTEERQDEKIKKDTEYIKSL
jgi:hypothetical protein